MLEFVQRETRDNINKVKQTKQSHTWKKVAPETLSLTLLLTLHNIAIFHFPSSNSECSLALWNVLLRDGADLGGFFLLFCIA